MGWKKYLTSDSPGFIGASIALCIFHYNNKSWLAILLFALGGAIFGIFFGWIREKIMSLFKKK